MSRSEGRILTSHSHGRLFKPGSGWNSPGAPAPPLSADQLQQEVTAMVQAQVDIGMDVVSNGQFAGPGSYSVYEAIDGFETKPVELADVESVINPRTIDISHARCSGSQASMPTSTSGGEFLEADMDRVFSETGPLKLKGLEPLKRDLQLLKDGMQATGATEGFFCITAPAWTEEFVWNEYYASDDEMVIALSEQMAPLYRTVADAGFTLQIDDLAISHDWEEVRRPRMSLEDYERFIMLRVEALHAALAGVAEEMIRHYVCWGSWPAVHTDDIPLKDIGKILGNTQRMHSIKWGQYWGNHRVRTRISAAAGEFRPEQLC